MLNLIPFRKEIESASKGESAWPYSSGKYILEAIDRAIAAESERDDLKSKIAEIEAQLPVAIKGCGAWDGLEILETLSDGSSLYLHAKPSQSIANNSEPVQRITEQDAREIIKSYMKIAIPFKVTFESWISAEGHDLLAKLNEHRAPVTAKFSGALTERH